MIKLAYITSENPYDDANNGGIGTYTGIIAHGMAKLGHQVHCITIGNRKDQEIESNLLVHYVPSPIVQNFTYLENMIAFSKKAQEIKSLYGLDIIESPEWLAQGGLLPMIKNVAVVTRLHTPLFIIEDLLNNQRLYRQSMKIQQLEKEQAHKSKGVTSPCASLSAITADRWGIKSTVIANPIDVSRFESQLTKCIGQQENQFLLYMGRLEYRKGVLTLAESLRNVLLYHQNLKVIFCGRDSLYGKKSMKSRIIELCSGFENRLIFIQHARFSEKKLLMKQATLVILPSLWENFSYVALEAMCMSKTIIASNVGGYPEMIEDGYSGYLVDPASPSLLAAKINLLLSGDLPLTGSQAYKRVREKFDINILSRVFEKYYHSMI